MTRLLEARGLWKRFGAVVAAAAIDIDVDAGEIHAVIGPNGAGKTTLLGLLSGELRPDSGHILLDGVDVSRLPVYRRARLGLARTFQVSSVLASFTVLENVAIALQGLSRGGFRLLRSAATDPALNEGARSVLSRLALLGLADRRASTLAHGERRLLEFAMAIAQRPKVLLLDEPLAGVGPGDAERLLAVLQATRRETAMLLVEHDMQAVFRVSDRITVLVHGQCIASGVPETVRADPSVRAAYLGEL